MDNKTLAEMGEEMKAKVIAVSVIIAFYGFLAWFGAWFFPDVHEPMSNAQRWYNELALLFVFWGFWLACILCAVHSIKWAMK